MTARPAALALVLLAAAPAAAQPKGEGDLLRPLPGNGTELFRGLLHYSKVEPIRPEQLGRADLSGVIVVVLGEPTPDIPLQAARVLRNGGALLVAAKHKASLAGYFPEPTRVEVTGETVYLPDPEHPSPAPQPREPGDIDKIMWQFSSPGPEWALFPGIDRLATHAPGALRRVERSRYVATVLAGYPDGCRVGRPDGDPLPDGRLFAVGGSGPANNPFRCLVLADPDVFSNRLIAASGRGEAQNLDFAVRVVDYLRGPNSRSQCLFVENGKVVEKFDDVKFEAIQSLPPLPVPPLPDPLDPKFQQRLTDSANEALAKWEDRGGPNRAIAGRPDDTPRFVAALRILALLAAVVVLLAGLRRVWRGRYEPDLPPVPTDTGRVAGSGPAGSLARRREEILQSGNYTAYVREYLRGLFAARGLPPQPEPPPRKPPAVQATGPDAKAIPGQLRILWGVAFGHDARPVTYTRWKELEPVVDAVRRAAEDGRWRFAPPGDRAP